MRLLRRLWFVITQRQREDDLAAELEFHRQMKASELRADGVHEHDVPGRTQRALGNDLLARERARDVWVAPWFQDMTQDLRFAVRMISKERRLLLTAVVALGLGIGVSNAAFTFANATILQDLPFDQPEQLLTIQTDDVRGFRAGVSHREFLEWREHLTVFDYFAATMSQSVNLSDDSRSPERLSGTYQTWQTFAMLRVAPILGRDFTNGDDRDGAPPVVILGHAQWVNRYGGDAAIIGRVVKISGQPATVIGVMPERFTFPLVADVWLPMAMAPGLRNTTWLSTGFGVIGRLRDGADRPQARAEIEALGARTVRDHPEMNKDRRLVVEGLKESSFGSGAIPLVWALLGGAVVVLLVASANVANLLLARAWNRSREIAVRVALGASRWRVVRQVLIECSLIGAGGGVLGAYLSYVFFQAMSAAFNVLEAGAADRPRKPYWFDPSVEATGWLFFGVAVVVASVGAAIIPALHLSRTSPNDVLKDGRDGPATRASRRWASALQVGQIAVAMMLLTVGALFARNFIAVYNTSPLIATENMVSVRLTLPVPKYAAAADRLRFVRLLDERLTANPEFAASAIASDVPLQTLGGLSRTIEVDGEPMPQDRPRNAVYIAAGPMFFETFAMPIVRGRALHDGDAQRGTEGAVVNERFSRLFFGDADPIGKRIRLSQPGPAPIPGPAWLTIVGVAPTLPDFMPSRPDDAAVYAPLLGDPTPSRAMAVIVKNHSKTAAVAALRNEVAQLDTDLPVYSVQTLDEMLALTRSGARMIGSWFQTLAIIAVVLACIGLYALTTHGVAQRTREIGVRMALGAHAASVTWLFIRQTMTLLGAGLVLGLAGALATSRFLAAFLGGVNPRDPATFAAAIAVLATVAIAAALAAARRAARVDPVVALKSD